MKRIAMLSIALLLLATVPADAGEKPAGMTTMTVGIVVFDGFLTSEVTAPIEVFGKASSKGATSFEVVTIAATKADLVSEEGLRLKPDLTYRESPEIDVLIVPSSLDVDGLVGDETLVSFVKEKAAEATYVASNCAGAFILGQAGYLDGRRVTTYIGGAEDLKKRYPKANVIDDQHVVADGNYVSSIGGVTSYEATFTLLEKITSEELANTVAEAIYYFPWLKSKEKTEAVTR